MKIIFTAILFSALVFLLTCDGIFANIAIHQKLAKQKAESQKSYFYKNYQNMDLDEQTVYLKSIGCKFVNRGRRFTNIDIDKEIYKIVCRSPV